MAHCRCILDGQDLNCDVSPALFERARDIEVGYRASGINFSLSLLDILQKCVSTEQTTDGELFNCKTAIKSTKETPVLGLPVFYSTTILVDRKGQRLGMFQNLLATSKKHPYVPASSHKIGIGFTKTENELEYLIYVLFGVDAFLLTVISGYIWNKRHEIAQMGINNFMNA